MVDESGLRSTKPFIPPESIGWVLDFSGKNWPAQVTVKTNYVFNSSRWHLVQVECMAQLKSESASHTTVFVSLKREGATGLLWHARGINANGAGARSSNWTSSGRYKWDENLLYQCWCRPSIERRLSTSMLAAAVERSRAVRISRGFPLRSAGAFAATLPRVNRRRPYVNRTLQAHLISQ